ncbi:MAG: TonB-dependent receptor [Ignavibacteriae bacterium]|nr:TonB-dependent receptor [Ignavibacteriota bacterium]
MSHSFNILKLLIAAIVLPVLCGSQLQAQIRDLTKLSLEELMNITVTSVSKRKEKLSEATAAVYVITQEDIKRSGLTNMPDLLRMVPGMQVAHIDANKWSISSRGFNSRFSNKLLVLIDGRSVYTPLFSGVHWDVQDLRLEDIERIEVIRGPGATLWGANAVNGVINVMTVSAINSHSGEVTAGGGSEDRAFGSIRYNGTVSNKGYYRIYAKGFKRDDAVTPSGDRASDRWNMYRGGIRSDWELTDGDMLTVQGDLYKGNLHQTVTIPTISSPYRQTSMNDVKVAGGNILARWNRSLSKGSELLLQIYFDHTYRHDIFHKEFRNTADLEFQHSFLLGSHHEIIWGLGYRLTADDITKSATVSFNPHKRTDNLFSGFFQDQISMLNHTLFLTLGSKLEHNDYTQFEVQPNVRLLWMPHNRHRIWAAVSRAVRTPSRSEDDVQVHVATLPPDTMVPLPTVITIFGNRDFSSENLIAYELGHRYQPVNRMGLDIAIFYNVYTDLRTVEPSGTPYMVTTPSPHIIIPRRFENRMDGKTYGAEFTSSWHPFDDWKLNTGYTWFKARLSLQSSSQDAGSVNAEGDSPQHQFHVRSYLNVLHNVEFDAAVYYVDRIANQHIPSYFRLDGRLGWHISEALQVSVVVQNILDAQHPEFASTPLSELASEIQRSAYGKATWKF